MAAVAVGGIGGWYLKDVVQAGRVTEGPEVIEIPAAVKVPDQVVPDLRGLSLTAAKQALADGGFDVASLVTTQVEWAGEAEIVLAQDPVFGEQVSGPLSLTVSAAATMPDVVGRPQVEVIDELRALGAEPLVVEEYDLSETTGTVLSVDVTPGDPLPLSPTLTVAQAGSSVFLASLDAVDSMCSRVEEQINGETHLNSLRCRPGDADNPNTAVWLINRLARQLTGIVGISDEDDTDEQAAVIITGDGTELARVSVSYADPASIDVDVTGVLRLEISVFSGETRSNAVLGDFLLKGTTSDIDTLDGQS